MKRPDVRSAEEPSANRRSTTVRWHLHTLQDLWKGRL